MCVQLTEREHAVPHQAQRSGVALLIAAVVCEGARHRAARTFTMALPSTVAPKNVQNGTKKCPHVKPARSNSWRAPGCARRRWGKRWGGGGRGVSEALSRTHEQGALRVARGPQGG